jgi:hypothetical protein
MSSKDKPDNLPKGLVSCTSGSHYNPCFCRNRRYMCPRCLRFVPWCFGSADRYASVCDDCYVQLDEGAEDAWKYEEPEYRPEASP